MTELLIADDEPDVLFVLERIFVKAGYAVLTAADGTSALATARERRPGLVLTDMNMPGLTGAEVCRAIRDDPEIGGTPVVVISGGLVSADPMMAAARPCAVVRKPFQRADLVDLMGRLAERGPHEHSGEPGVCLP